MHLVQVLNTSLMRSSAHIKYNMITTEQIKELRDLTGVSVMQCKKALEEAEGDKDKALLILKKKSADIASKKADRTAADGLIVVKEGENKAILVVLNCETDFVAKNDDFIKLTNNLAELALKEGVSKAKEMSADMINPIIQKIGENIQIGQIEEITGNNLGIYVHNGKQGVVISLEGGTKDLSKDLAMHIAAMKPEFVKRDDINADTVAKVKDIFTKEVEESDKPAEIKEKMLAGKVSEYFKEKTLLEQSFIKNPDISISDLLKNANATVISFVRITI